MQSDKSNPPTLSKLETCMISIVSPDLLGKTSFFQKVSFDKLVRWLRKCGVELTGTEVDLSKSSVIMTFAASEFSLNHGFKRAEEKLPEAQDIIKKSLLELYRFKGVTTIEDDRKELIIDGVVYMHGYRSKLGDHTRYNNRSTVVGHSHVGGVVFCQYDKGILFELNAGFLADETAEPLRYRPQTISRWTLGYGLIDEKGPRFCPIEV